MNKIHFTIPQNKTENNGLTKTVGEGIDMYY